MAVLVFGLSGCRPLFFGFEALESPELTEVADVDGSTAVVAAGPANTVLVQRSISGIVSGAMNSSKFGKDEAFLVEFVTRPLEDMDKLFESSELLNAGTKLA